jgi:hypothetical protein
MDIKELFQSIFDSSNERIKNPFIGSYITAFILYNWRAIFLLVFSNATIEDKIVVINHEYCTLSAILWPLSIAFFYILILPYLNLIFDALLSYSNSKKNIRLKASVISKLEQKKAEAKYEREIAEERAGTSEISELKNQIERLNSENEKLSQQNKESFDRYNEALKIKENNEKELSKALVESENKFKNLEKETNKKASENNTSRSLKQLILSALSEKEISYFKRYGAFKESNTKVKGFTLDSVTMDRLSELGLIKRDENIYVFTDLGNEVYAYLKEEGL